MSLIQAALDRQTKPLPTRKKMQTVVPESLPQLKTLQSLKALDGEVEKKILAIERKPGTIQKPQTSPIFLFALLGLLLITGAYYLIQNHTETEATPPSVVGIERRNLNSPKSAQAQDPSVQRSAHAVFTQVDSKGRFFLSGIAWGGAQPYAIINGQILRAGEMVEKKVLLEVVERDYVILNNSGELIQLVLKR